MDTVESDFDFPELIDENEEVGEEESPAASGDLNQADPLVVHHAKTHTAILVMWFAVKDFKYGIYALAAICSGFC